MEYPKYISAKGSTMVDLNSKVTTVEAINYEMLLDREFAVKQLLERMHIQSIHSHLTHSSLGMRLKHLKELGILKGKKGVYKGRKCNVAYMLTSDIYYRIYKKRRKKYSKIAEERYKKLKAKRRVGI